MSHPFLTNPDGTVQVRNAEYDRWSVINCEVNHKDYGWIPFTANPNDPEEYGRTLYQQLVAGELGPVAPVDQARLDTQQARLVRIKRDKLLLATDWTQLGDSPVQPVDAWRDYRQALRDISLQEGFPNNVVWPQAPQ